MGKYEQEWEIKALSKSYKEDEFSLGVPDYNHKILAQYMRMRLLHPLIVKELFEDVLNKKTIKPSDLENKQNNLQKEKDLDKFKNLTKASKRELSDHAYKMLAYGNRIGFAVDIDTLETLETTKVGTHEVVDLFLRSKIEKRCIQKNKKREKIRIIRGVIVNLRGFETPFLFLNSAYEEYFTPKVINFLKRKNLIVVETDYF